MTQPLPCPVCNEPRWIVRDSKGAGLVCWNGCCRIEGARRATIREHPDRVITAKSLAEMVKGIREAGH